MSPYQYLVLRCVPRVDRGESINVGVVLYEQTSQTLTCASHLDEARLVSLAPDLDPEQVRRSLAVITDVCAGRSGQGRPSLATLGQRFGWIAAPRSTVIQPGPVHGGVTADVAAEVERLLDRYVR